MPTNSHQKNTSPTCNMQHGVVQRAKNHICIAPRLANLALFHVQLPTLATAMARYARCGGQPLHPPFNTMTPAMTIDRLVCAAPWVCTILCVHRQPFPKLRVATLDAGASSPPPPPSITWLLRWLQTALCAQCFVYAPSCMCTANPSQARCKGQPPHPFILCVFNPC